MATTLEAVFHVPVVVMLLSETVVTFIERRGKIEPLDVEMEASQSSLTNRGASSLSHSIASISAPGR